MSLSTVSGNASIIFDLYGGLTAEGSESTGLDAITSFKMVATNGDDLKSLTPEELQPVKEYVISTELPLQGNYEKVGDSQGIEGIEKTF